MPFFNRTKLKKDEWDLIQSLMHEGKDNSEIVKLTNRTLVTICKVRKQLNVKFEDRSKKKIGVMLGDPLFDEINLSSLPDTILFEHTREFIF